MAVQAAHPELNDPKAYQNRMFAFLGDRDPLEVLAGTADALADIVKRHPADVMRRRPFEGKWTPNEVIGHLSDSEWVYGFRVRMILCQDRPTLLGMDQDLWVAGQRLNEREPMELVTLFRELRKGNLALWKRMTPADLERVGLHAERGPEPLSLIRRMNAGHDLSHLDQINRYLAAIQGRA